MNIEETERHKRFAIALGYILNRRLLLCICTILSLISLYISTYYLKEHDLTLFASSGAVMTIAGLFLTIKRTLVILWIIPFERATNVIKYGGGAASLASKNTPEDYEKAKDVIGDEKYGVMLIIMGTLIWAYSAYLPRVLASLGINFT